MPLLGSSLLNTPAIVDRKEHEERNEQYARNRDLVGQSHNENSVSWKGSFTAKISGSTCAVVQEFKWIALSLATIWVVALCVPSVQDSCEWLEMPAATRVVLEVARRLCSRVRPFPAAGLLFASVEDRARVPEFAPLDRTDASGLSADRLGFDPSSRWLLAAALNCLVATFPVSIVCGLLFLANYRGLTGELGYALLRRYRIWGWLAWSPRCMRLGFAPQTSDNSHLAGVGRILSFPSSC